MPDTQLTLFDFDGFDSSRVTIVDGEVLVHANPFIKWLGWTTPSRVIRDNLQPGDYVEGVHLHTPSGTQTGIALTKRGVRRLLFRSDHPHAVEYADRVLDALDEIDRDGTYIPPNLSDWQRARGYGKLERRSLTDAIQLQTRATADERGKWYGIFTALVNQHAGVVPGNRNALTEPELKRVAEIEQYLTARLANRTYLSMEDAYRDVRRFLAAVLAA